MKNEDVKIGMRVSTTDNAGMVFDGTVSGISSKLPLVNVWIITLEKPLDHPDYKGWTA